MAALSIIKEFDIFKDRPMRLGIVLPPGMIHPFGFEQMKKGLGYGVIPTVAFADSYWR